MIENERDGFIERVDILQQIIEALELARSINVEMIDGDEDAAMNNALYMYPKMRFIHLSISRYLFAANFIGADDLVIDVPCGTGYGAAILGSTGCNVLGIDIDEDSIRHARDMYKYPNVNFEIGDMMDYKFPEADVIVCLDGLEHVEDGEALIQRFIANLSEGGRLIVTVPINEDHIRPDAHNPFHLADYDEESFRELLERYFSKVMILGHDATGSMSDVSFVLDGLFALCEV